MVQAGSGDKPISITWETRLCALSSSFWAGPSASSGVRSETLALTLCADIGQEVLESEVMVIATSGVGPVPFSVNGPPLEAP